jgi:hypothetical protein
MKTVTKEVKVVSLSLKNVKEYFKDRLPKLKALITKKAKGFWGRIKPKLANFHNRLSNKWAVMFDKLSDKCIAKAEKVMDKLAKRLGLDPEDESWDGDSVIIGTGSINDMADIDG